jgi:uncharacterized RDD family membrane protein YckC
MNYQPEYFGVETTQNVILEQELASVWQRMLAFLLDFAFMIVYAMIIGIFIGMLKTNAIVAFILFLPIICYGVFTELIFNGQTPGKMILQIKVVRTDGATPGFFNYFIRWIFSLIDVAMSFGSVATLSILMSGKGQRIGDIVSHTTVIRTKSLVRLEHTLLRPVPPNYRLVFPNVARLSEEDINVVHETISYMNQSFTDNSQNLGMSLKAAIEKKINGGVQIKMDCYSFLQTVIYDYNYLNRIES